MKLKITLTGPRSVGKSTIAKLLSKKLDIQKYSSDEIGENYFKKQGGLNKVIESGIIHRILDEEAYSLIRKFFETNEKSFIFDLSGGPISSRKHKKASEKIRKLAKKNSIVIGLLPSKNMDEAIKFLFGREKTRKHFKKMDLDELFYKVKDSYEKYPKILEKLCDSIIYIEGKNIEEMVDEIILHINKFK